MVIRTREERAWSISNRKYASLRGGFQGQTSNLMLPLRDQDSSALAVGSLGEAWQVSDGEWEVSYSLKRVVVQTWYRLGGG